MNPSTSDRVELRLPEPPSLNKMLNYAKQRDRRRRPVIYDRKRREYQLKCADMARRQGVRAWREEESWDRWTIERAHFRLWNERDPTELAAGLKWAVDFLIHHGIIKDDSPREMETPKCWPTQEVDRGDRGLDLVVVRIE